MADNRRKKLSLGILAHVDAGKTTLSEAFLFASGKLRRLGRVDHGDTFLDTDPIERERGITVFAKAARFSFGESDFTLLDTPGHTDFSCEAERVLSVLDYAVLVISAGDGVTNHTVTLWQLLKNRRIPTFFLVNKTDLPYAGAETLASELQEKLSPEVFPFYPDETPEQQAERLATVSEDLLEAYLSSGQIDEDTLRSLIAERRLFPCFFGSALKNDGVGTLLSALDRLTLEPIRKESFSARVFKISREENVRFTEMKITGGSLSVRDSLTYEANGQLFTEKISRMELLSGTRGEQIAEAFPGDIVRVRGLSATYAGEGLGGEADDERPILEPVLSYRVVLPDDCDVRLFYPKVKELEEEDPTLQIAWKEEAGEISIRLMGEVQTEILAEKIKERFGVSVSFDRGRILYRETIASPVIGVGHFEPLRHYAEVQLLLEPLPEGSGILIESALPNGASIDRNFRHVILSALRTYPHKGVLTGSLLTDMKITLLAARVSLKHTDGGDLYEAARRAVRQGLMQAKSVLLEPFESFTLTLPSQVSGRAIHDLEMRSADFKIEKNDGSETTVIGRAPVSELCDYPKELIAYTRGEGRLFTKFDGYAPCHNTETVLLERSYRPEADTANPASSVFCAHGAGFYVPWNEVANYQHTEPCSLPAEKGPTNLLPPPACLKTNYALDDDELEKLLLREFGPIRRRQYREPKKITAAKTRERPENEKELFLIDGYNLIFAWDDLAKVAEDDLEHARDLLCDLLDSYTAYTKQPILLIFDAYQVAGSVDRESKRERYTVIFTAENETADAYIERKMAEIGKTRPVRVVTSDRLIQVSTLGSGGFRMSAREFKEEVLRVGREISEFIEKLASEKK